MSWFRLFCLAICLGTGLLAHPSRADDPHFVYGAILDLKQTDDWLDLDTLAPLKFNTFMCWATRERSDWSIWLPRLDSMGLQVWGGNGMMAELSDQEKGHILSNLHKRSWRRCLYTVWPAEDTTAFGNPVLLQLTHAAGQRTAAGWEVRQGRDSAGVVQSGPGLWSGGGSPAKPVVNFTEYQLRISDTNGLRPETPVCRLYGTYRRGDCQYVANPFYDTILYRRDFPDSGWQRVLFRYDLAADSADLPSGCDPEARTTAMLDFNIYWYGLGGLEIDWVRAMDSAGWELVLGPEELRRGPIKAQAAYFKDTPVVTWFGDESGWHTPYKTYAYFFVDSLVRGASEGDAGVFTDLHMGILDPEAYWDYFMYASLRHGDRTFYPWISPFRSIYAWARNQDSLQVRCYDKVTRAVEHNLKRWLDTVPDARWIPDVQCYSEDPRPDTDISPTANDVVCLSFVYLAHGATGLMYHRYDGGVWTNGQASWGLVYDYQGRQRTSTRYAAIRDRVAPLIVDRGWGDTVMTLRHRGAGSADTVRHIAGSTVRRVRSDRRPMYIEIGFFDGRSDAADYVMIVNRRTLDTSAQRVTLELEPSRLKDPVARAYRVTDLRTGQVFRVPGSRPVLEPVAIGPGDPAFYRIEAVEGL